MTKLKLHETKKLHYGKYLYKLRFDNDLAGIFRTDLQRNTKLSYAKSKLKEYLEALKKGAPIKKSTMWGAGEIISITDLNDANSLYNILKNRNEHILRCEYKTIIIYTNDRDLCLKISKKLKTEDMELWEPDPSTISYLLATENIIITDTPHSYPYKISFGRKPANPELAKWIDANRDKVQIGSRLLENFRNSESWIQGSYIYARDKNVILLLQMFVGDNITKIDKLVYKGDIDK